MNTVIFFKKFLNLSKISSLLIVLCLSTFSFSAFSQEIINDENVIAKIKAALLDAQLNVSIGDISSSPLEGFYQVDIGEGKSLYITEDTQFFIPGDLYQFQAQGLVNLGEQNRNVQRIAKIAEVDESEMIIFSAQDEKARITVFTDVDCPYCQKLHGDMPQLNAMGITVRYLAFPRTGLDTETYFKMVSTWCSDNRKAMFTSAKRGGDVANKACDNPIAEHYQLGRDVGVTGTPALVFEDGTLIPGYIPAESLIGYLLGTP